MSPAMKRSLVAEISQYQQSPTPDAVDLLSNRGEPDTEENALNPKSIGESVAEILNSMEQELDSIDGPIAIPGNKIAIKAADLLSLRLDSSNESDDRAKIDRQRYRQVILLLDNLARHLRLSDRIQEQDYADMIERWLVGELSLSGRREMFTDRQYARVVLRLADEDARHQARRRATVMIMFWGEEFTKRTSYQFEKIVATGHQPILAPRWLVTQRDAAILTEILLNRLESAVPEPIAYAGELDGNDFGWWPKIGMLWHRPWEAKAKQLAESFESTPQEKGNIDE
jgi:hypothetical protein